AVFDERSAYRAEHGQGLLSLGFWGHKAHRWTSRGLADRLGISEVVLVAFHVRSHEMRSDELGRMPQLGDFLRHEMRSAASLHHDGTGFEVCQILEERHSSKFFAVKLMTAIIL